MKIESRLRNLWFLVTVPLFASVLLVFSFRAIPAPNSEYPIATYNRGTLHVTIPYSGPPASGQLTVEVLDPEDHILGRVSRSAAPEEKNGAWQVNLPLARPLPVDDLVWQRLRYLFVPSGGGAVRSGTESISRILRMPVLHIVGQQSYSSGAPAAVRVVVTDSRNRPVPGRNFLRIELAPPDGKPRVLFAGLLNQRGTTEARFRLPAGLAGPAVLRYTAGTPLGSAEFSQPVRLEDQVSVLLTTEKPIYQPGQTIHVRALALDRASHAAAAGRQLIFEIEDSRGNKVFKKTAQTSKFGVASAEFTLASEVNLGAYRLRASTDAGRSEITFQVERYVLPKFKVMLDFAAASHGYRPGDRVTGVVRANYFFGQPVNGAPVTVKASAMDVSVHEVASAEGKTGADGSWNFDFRLPDYFAGRPLSQGAARVLVEATVTDSAGHPETRGLPITVSESPLLLTAVPESGKLVPHLENQVFLLASYPDGTPAVAELRVHASGSPDQTVNTDAGGVAVVRLKSGDSAEALRIDAEDARGNRASATVPLETRGGLDQVLLRTERAVYRPGDRVLLRIFTTSNAAAAYVDVVKDGQTILTRDVDLAGGRADLSLTVTPEMAGTLDLHAYVFGRDARPVADHRLIFVQPADALKIEAAAGAPVYLPGADARVRFHVTNARGEGVQAALGVQVVDEAVFALADKRPGFAKVFFYLEQEAMKPRYEIHSIGLPDIIEPAARASAAQRDRAARALFAATELVNPNRFETELGRSVPQAKYSEYSRRYLARFVDQARTKLTRAYGRNPDLTRAAAQFRDAWANRVRIERAPWNSQAYILRSAGPDKRFDTADDLGVMAQVHAGIVSVNPMPASPGRIRVGGNVRMFAMAGLGGGVVGGILGGVPAAAPPSPEAAAQPAVFHEAAALKDVQPPSAPRVRSYFPEALFINPEIITDESGRASISIPLADSITTWRMALTASTAGGALGSANSSLKVFQDFFVDLDLPVTLTQGDRVTIPVAVYNYSGARGSIDLKLQPADWFSLVNDSAEKSLAVDSGRAGGAEFTLQANRIGKFKLTLAARMNGPASRADIIMREIEVVPNGREQNLVFNGRLEASASHELNFPPEALPDAGAVLVRLYPGPLSQVIEGMDSLLRMPFGCFEQTSSVTYPNVLALDYMKRTGKLTPEIRAKADGFIANGYQRLLTFEVPGGGFSWFGQAPANKILTSYGLMEFSDMSKVHEVDPNIIRRTQQWLAAQQQPDGSWQPDTSFINEGATNRYNSDVLRITAYIGWALENTGYQGGAVGKALRFIDARLGSGGDAPDPYTLAVLANFAADGNGRESTRRAIERLLDARTEKGDQAWWSSRETGVFATGSSAAVETTGLAVQALLKSGEASAVAAKALRYLASKKDAAGTWGTTQATIMALRALLLSTAKSSADVEGAVQITLDGRPVETLTLTPDNNDLFHQFVFPRAGANRPETVALRFTGRGGLAYQVVGRYFVPWSRKPAGEPLSINVTYDRTKLARNDVATATAIIRNNLPQSANMVMVDLGIPPGFDLLTEDLESYQEQSRGRRGGHLEKFNLTGTQAILYFDSFAPGQTAALKFRLRAKYPIRARGFQSRVYEYYDPAVSAVSAPVPMEVTR